MESIAKKTAREFAIESHGSQMYGEKPYIFHLDCVADLVKSFTTEQHIIDAAYLHDTLEDTEADPVKIEALFGLKTLHLVEAVTKVPNLTRKAGFVRNMQKVREGGADAVLLKLCDRIANVSNCIADKNESLLKMYVSEHVGFMCYLHRDDEHEELWNRLRKLMLDVFWQ